MLSEQFSMKIFLGTRYSGGISPGAHLADAFRRLGHQVFTIGPSTDPYITQDYFKADGVINGIELYNLERVISETFDPDLVIQVEPGVFFTNLENFKKPIITWLIDTYLNIQPNARHWLFECIDTSYLKRIANNLFTAKIPHLAWYKRAGIFGPRHLALALDELIYKPFKQEKKYDIVFIGNTTYEERRHLIQLIKAENLVCWINRVGLIRDDYCRKISEAHILLNHGHVGELNMRFFEGMGIGVFQLCNICHGAETLGYIDGEHYVSYVTDIDLLNTINHYVNGGPDALREAAEIAAAGRNFTLAHHTYIHRAKYILENIVS